MASKLLFQRNSFSMASKLHLKRNTFSMASNTPPPVVLFGYDSSPFTQKVKLSLRLKQIPYTFITVPSMMPRPIIKDSFGVTYRKIPIMLIGRDLYCDTSIILEALEQTFPSPTYPSLYPKGADGRTNRSLIRGFASYWTDKPFFRVTTGLIPSSVWRTDFGKDRAGLIGHKLDPDKLESKVPRNLSSFDMHLGMFETHFQSITEDYPWIFSTKEPSLADIALYYQLDWGNNIAAGRGIEDLTGGGTSDTNAEGASAVFNPQRYSRLWEWYLRFKNQFAALTCTETRIERSDKDAAKKAIDKLKAYPIMGKSAMLNTAAVPHIELDARIGLVEGSRVSIAPDDTGRDDPTVGKLIGLSPEEIVIEPYDIDGRKASVQVAIHFPRLGFVVKPVRGARL